MTIPSTSLELVSLLKDRREHELALLTDLTTEQLQGVALRDVERPIWEMGHVGWFQEYWILRHLFGAEPMIDRFDDLYDSSLMYSHQRWDTEFPSRSETLRYINTVLERCVSQLITAEPTNEEIYYYLLAIFHEDMHAETMTFIRQTLGYATPQLSTFIDDRPRLSVDTAFRFHDVTIPAGICWLGADPDAAFVFDNEKWAHPVEIGSFSISATAVTNEQFLEFVEAGGYHMQGIWGRRGKDWLRRSKATCPLFWSKGLDGNWYRKDFDKTMLLEPFHPIVHVNWYEANAYCNWANRRLPTEAEWEMAASFVPGQTRDDHIKSLFPWGDDEPTLERVNMDWTSMGCIDVRALPLGDSPVGCRQMIGNVWEWTADTFEAYPGFIRDPYSDYSEPSFGKKKVLKGGSWATRSLLIRNTWRNFYMPFRNNVYAGFRTCALR